MLANLLVHFPAGCQYTFIDIPVPACRGGFNRLLCVFAAQLCIAAAAAVAPLAAAATTAVQVCHYRANSLQLCAQLSPLAVQFCLVYCCNDAGPASKHTQGAEAQLLS